MMAKSKGKSDEAVSSNWKALQATLNAKKVVVEQNPIKKAKSRAKKQRRAAAKHAKSTPATTSNEDTAVALDCEMVGGGPEGRDDILARVSIVDANCKCIFDKYVAPTIRVTDYRTDVSGIRPRDILDGENALTVKAEVQALIADRRLIAHGIRHDLRVLGINHPLSLRRDTAKFKPLRQCAGLDRNTTPSLKKLANHLLGIAIQAGEHDSIQDARIAMRLYQLKRKDWEKEIKEKLKMARKLQK